MAKLQKKLKKDAAKLSDRLFGKKSPTLRHTFSCTTSLYCRKKPCFSVSWKGDCRISVLKLVLILIAAGTALTLAILALRELLARIRQRRMEKDFLDEEIFFDDEEDENGEELPF